jgi:hypothetical protein
VALTDDGSNGQRIIRDADSVGESGDDSPNIAPVCAPDVPDCEDIIVNPDGGGAAGICLEGTVDCVDTPSGAPEDDACVQILPTPPECADPDAPVSNEPSEPGTADPGEACTLEYPNECAGTKAAVADLAARLDVEREAIAVVSAERVDWPNACLGVEQPDVACAEVITAGYRIFLEANGQKYEYHTDGGSRVVLVE